MAKLYYDKDADLRVLKRTETQRNSRCTETP